MEKSYTNTVLQAITRSLNEGINERTAMIFIIAAIVILVIMLTLIIRFKNRKKIISSAEASYQKLIRRFNLTILELDLIDDLAQTLHKPEDKYNLLINKSRFRQAEHKSEASDEKSKLLLEGLKIKLGFVNTAEDEGIISTRLLQNGHPVQISEQGDSGEATVYSVAETSITVKYPNQNVPVTLDDEIDIFSCIKGSLRLFKLYPDKIKGELFSSPHSNASKIERLNIKLDTLIKYEDSEEGVSGEVKSKLVMLTEQGALIHDKKTILKPGMIVKIFLSNDRKQAHHADGEVVKISEEKQLASLKFISLNE